MKSKNLACIGTLLTILTLGFDVFSQQIIGLGDRLVPDATAIASVPRTEFYSSGSTGTHTSWYPDPAMKASIKTGIMMENVPDLTVSCSTGNCTWPMIPTLTACGACTNVTASLSRTNDTWPNIYMHTLPNGKSWTGPGPDLFRNVPSQMLDMVVSHHKYHEVNQDVMDEGDQPLYIVNFGVIGLPWRPNLVAEPNPAEFHATACALWWCLQAYQITVNSTQQLQTAVQTWSQRT